MVLYVQNVQNILRKCLLYTEVTDRLTWRSTCLRECTFTAAYVNLSMEAGYIFSC